MRRLGAFLALLLAAALPAARACSRVLYKSDNGTVLVTRSMDWVEDLATDFYAFPAGMQRDGGAGEGLESVKWTSKFGSVVASGYDMTVDGLNEKGLTANLLYLSSAKYPPQDPVKPQMLIGLWAQYALDNFATVDEFVKDVEQEKFQLIAPRLPVGADAALHLSVGDATGDNAILEYTNGSLNIHHSSLYKVMTNDPPFEEQLAIEKQWRSVGGMNALPGTFNPADRFVRLAFLVDALPKTGSYRDMLAGSISMMRWASIPYGITVPGHPNICSTRWRTLADATNSVYYFDSATQAEAFWVKLKDLDLSNGAPVKKLNMADGTPYSGNAAAQFVQAEPFKIFGAT